MSEEYRPEENPTPEAQPEQRRPISFNLIQGKPYATWALIAVTVLVYGLQALSKWRYGRDYPILWGMNFGPYITYRHEYWRLITPVFLHASITHILFNMYALFTLGPALEKYYGHLNFMRFYLISGFAGNVVSYLASPNSGSVGASTAIFGLVAAQGMFLYKNKRLIRNYKAAMQNIGFVIVINLLLGLRGGIDNWGHIGGLLGGGLLAWLAGPEFSLVLREDNDHLEMVDTISQSRREISFALVTLFFAALAYAFGR